MVIDPLTDEGARAVRRLRDDKVGWLITVAADGTPVPTPVWFWWDGDTILVFSQRDKPKLRHIATNPRVAVALRTDELTVVTGKAAIDSNTPSADRLAGYVENYGTLIERLGADPASFAAEYAVPVRITPTKLRQWSAG